MGTQTIRAKIQIQNHLILQLGAPLLLMGEVGNTKEIRRFSHSGFKNITELCELKQTAQTRESHTGEEEVVNS